MKKQLPKRKSIRLQGYDYGSEGCYFITICTERCKNLLSTVAEGDDHIIRNQSDYEHHWNYIEYNALKEYK